MNGQGVPQDDAEAVRWLSSATEQMQQDHMKRPTVVVAAVLTVAAVVSLVSQAPDSVPPLDTTKHSVPLEEIYFDTFQPTDRALRLPDATPEVIDRLRDAIPPLHEPQYESADEVRWLRDDDAVIGYAEGDSAWAYPIRILNFHEIVNDMLGGVAVLVSYCPLCGSGVVFSRQVEGRVLTFGNTSALYESDMVMLDYETGSYWWQVAGRAIVGSLTDTSLVVLPATTTSWKVWKQLHPDTVVLSRATGYRRDYDRDPFIGYASQLNHGGFAFPVTPRRYTRLEAGTMVLTVRLGDTARAYPLETKGVDIAHDELGNEPIVIFLDGAGGAAAFRARLNEGEPGLSFRVRDGTIFDRTTKTHWDLAGRATQGTLAGRELRQLPSKTTYWFAAVASEPDITVHRR